MVIDYATRATKILHFTLYFTLYTLYLHFTLYTVYEVKKIK